MSRFSANSPRNPVSQYAYHQLTDEETEAQSICVSDSFTGDETRNLIQLLTISMLNTESNVFNIVTQSHAVEEETQDSRGWSEKSTRRTKNKVGERRTGRGR